MVANATFKWEHIVCEDKITSTTANKVKEALVAKGFKPGPMDGKLAAADWSAISDFQQKNGLGVGDLTYETMNKLGVPVR